MNDEKSPPLDSFVTQFWRDQEGGAVRPLDEYLGMFPGDAVSVALKYVSLTESPATPGLGGLVGHYRLIEELGRGGQAVVYLAEDTRIRDRRVALKVLTDPSLLASGPLERFRREAEVASKLEHPGICPVYEAGVDEARPFIAMRYVAGETLARRILDSRGERGSGEAPTLAERERPRRANLKDDLAGTDPSAASKGPASRVEVMNSVGLIERVARALHVAHEAGVIHRDVKPANIMVTREGDPVLMDFGLAREVEGQTLTLTGDFFGTPSYMSPEQLLAQRVHLDRRSDVWSLGVTLYECLTGLRPFEAPTREGLFHAIQSKDPPDPRKLNAAVPTDLRVVLETALDKDRDRRYQSALGFAEDLRRVRDCEPIAARPASAWIKLMRWTRRSPAVAGGLAGSLLFLVAGLAASLYLLEKERYTSSALDRKVTEYDQMSDAALVEELRVQTARLWPRRPHLLPVMSSWLTAAREVHARLPLHEAALQELRDRAAPYDARQREADAEMRREIHGELLGSIAIRREQIREAEQALMEFRGRLGEIEKGLEAEENERVILQYERRREQLQQQIEEMGAVLAASRAEVVALEDDPRLTERLTWVLTERTDRWRHGVLSQTVEELRHFGPLIDDMEERRAFAAQIEHRSIGEHSLAWDRCLRNVTTNPKYPASPELSAMKPQVGLVPLGIDRDSGLWEFWHVGSGERPQWDGVDWSADSGADPRGKVRISEVSGIVFVLLPGGTFPMGASREFGARNHDPEAVRDERPVHEVTLGAFLIAKHELTQAQWERLMGDRPSRHLAGTTDYLGGLISSLHPVTGVSWAECREAMRRCDLELPTEARWEYSCRAGTSTVWWCGNTVASIQEHRAGNIADLVASERQDWTVTYEVDDGFLVHAAVGCFAPNAFGLHDVLGNVCEWCEDLWGIYALPPRPGDGLRGGSGPRVRVHRGGSFFLVAAAARSAHRNGNDSSYRSGHVGCRPARGIAGPIQ